MEPEESDIERVFTRSINCKHMFNLDTISFFQTADVFNSLDVNGDGKLTEDEFVKYLG